MTHCPIDGTALWTSEDDTFIRHVCPATGCQYEYHVLKPSAPLEPLLNAAEELARILKGRATPLRENAP